MSKTYCYQSLKNKTKNMSMLRLKPSINELFTTPTTKKRPFLSIIHPFYR